MKIKNPFRKWWQLWKPQHIDLTKADNKPRYPMNATIVHDGQLYKYMKMKKLTTLIDIHQDAIPRWKAAAKGVAEVWLQQKQFNRKDSASADPPPSP